MAGYRVTVRRGPKVVHEEHDTLDDALTAVEEAIDAVHERRDPVRFIGREIPAAQQVVARAEVAGPGGVRGGVDLRGDGSAEAFTGRWRRRLVAQDAGETAPAALRRALGQRP